MREMAVPLCEMCGSVEKYKLPPILGSQSHTGFNSNGTAGFEDRCFCCLVWGMRCHIPSGHTYIHTAERDFSQATMTDLLVPWAAGTHSGTHEWTEGKLPTQRQSANAVSMSVNLTDSALQATQKTQGKTHQRENMLSNIYTNRASPLRRTWYLWEPTICSKRSYFISSKHTE